MRTWVIALLVATAPLIRADEAPFTGDELSEFLGPVSPDVIHWNRVGAVDFVVYHGVAQPPLSGRVGFYLGGHPDFRPESGSATFKGRLGIFPLKWYRKVAANGTITQSAVVKLDYYWKAHVWVTAAGQSDMDQLIAILSRLPTFTKKPKPIPGMPQTALEYYAEPITGAAVFFAFVVILISVGWLLHRRWRRAQENLARRLFLLAAYVGCAMIAIAAVAIGSVQVLLTVFSRFHAARGLAIGSACVLLVAAISLIVFLIAGLVVRKRLQVQHA